MPKPEQARAAADTILKSFEALIGRARVADSGEARIGACLVLTIFEQFRAAMCLVDANHASHAAGPIRSMLEGVADLMNLSADAQYLDQLRYENARSNVALFNDILKMEDVPEDMAKKVSQWKEHDEPIRDELGNAGRDKIAIDRKLKDVGLGGAYVQYRILCAFVHTSLTSLITRHAGPQRMSDLEYCRPVDPPVVAMLLLIATDLLVRAGSELHRFTDLTADEVNAAGEEAKRVWEGATAEA